MEELKKRYKVTIEEVTPYKKKDNQYEAEDKKIYTSTYSIPEGTKWKKVSFETGEIGETSKNIYTQEIQSLEIFEVIKTINVNSD